MNIYHQALIIDSENFSIYGILRSSNISAKKIIVFVPAITGTRIGPHRMFVEMSHKICQYGIATLCIDTPLYGDSYIKSKAQKNDFFSIYFSSIEIVLKYLRLHYKFDDIIFSSISLGCMPILKIAEENGLDKVILLSPNHLSGDFPIVDKYNLRAYAQKVFKLNTWNKIFRLKVNWSKVLSNIFHRKKSKYNADKIDDQKNRVNVLCIFGEKDNDYGRNSIFWQSCIEKKRFLSFTQKRIANADHSFMDWSSKRMLESAILEWLK